ncbi:MAG: hypothetical protein V9G10_09785 [Candidatus Nanopelagicales bacterium]
MVFNPSWQDTSVRVQDDFYRHWLGQWLDTFEIPDDKAEFASFTDLHDKAQDQLRTIIEDLAAAEPDPVDQCRTDRGAVQRVHGHRRHRRRRAGPHPGPVRGGCPGQGRLRVACAVRPA